MEELVLHLLLAGHKLHVVHQQQVGFPVLGPEFAAPASPDQLDEFVDEVVALDVDDLGVAVVFPDYVGNGVQQVRLAQAGVAVDQQGVVVLGGMLRHCHGGGVGQLVAGAYHEGIEGELCGGEPLADVRGDHLPVELSQFVHIQDLHLKLHGKHIQKYGLDVFDEQGFNISFFEVVGAV